MAVMPPALFSGLKHFRKTCYRQIIFFVHERVKHWYLKTAYPFVPLPGQRLLLLFPPSLTLKTGGKIRCFLGIFLGVSRWYGLCLSCPVIQKMSRRRGANPAARLFISYAYRCFFPAIRCWAICTALSAAPFLIWSPTTQKERPRSSAMSLRTRPT